jgi:hypothetical protein
MLNSKEIPRKWMAVNMLDEYLEFKGNTLAVTAGNIDRVVAKHINTERASNTIESSDSYCSSLTIESREEVESRSDSIASLFMLIYP